MRSLHEAEGRRGVNFAPLTTWPEPLLLDCAAANMASRSLARCKIHGAMLARMSRTPIDDCQIFPIFSALLKFSAAEKLIPVRAPWPIFQTIFIRRWNSGDGSRYSCCSGRQLRRLGRARRHWAGARPLPYPRSRRTGRPTESPRNARPNSSFTSLMEERSARVLGRGAGQVVPVMKTCNRPMSGSVCLLHLGAQKSSDLGEPCVTPNQADAPSLLRC
jgi:hypothetical protein